MSKNRRTARRRKQQPPRRQPRTWEWLAVVAPLMGVAGYLLRDFYGFRLETLGSFIWLLVLAVTFLLGMGYFAQFLVPAGWQEGLALLATTYLGGAGDPPARSAVSTGAEPDPADVLPASLWTVRAGIVDSHIALALLRGNVYARAAGPGYVRLFPGERIGQAIDLRPQSRRQEIKGRSRDGIPLTGSVGVRFQARRQPEAAGAAEAPYPYDPEAIFLVSHAGSVDEPGDVRPWHEQIAPEAAARLVAELSAHTLDQLYGDIEDGGLALAEIRGRLRRDLAELFGPRGVEILSAGPGPLQVPDNVVEQRVQNWQARWTSEMEKRQGESSARVLRAQQRARAEVQREIIHRIAQGLETIKDAGPHATEVFAWHVLQTMEKAIADDVRHSRISSEVVDTLDRMAGLIGLNAGDDGGGTIITHVSRALPERSGDDAA